MREDCGDRDVYLNQKFWCKKCGIDYQRHKEKIRELNARIIALGKSTLKQYSTENAAWKAIVKALDEAHQDSAYLDKVSNLTSSKEKKEDQIDSQEHSLLKLFFYLLLVEGMFVKYARILTILLIENDHDLFDPVTRDFISSFEKIEKIDFSIQLKFLRKHGFAFFIDCCDKKLRNDIAHLNLVVMSDGKIFNKETGLEISDLDDKIMRLNWVLTLVGCALDYMLWKQDPEQNYLGIK